MKKTKSRYNGKPFLRLIECFVLRSIGKLSIDQNATLTKMEPKLREIYKQSGSWYEIILNQMAFPTELPKQIFDVWNQELITATKNGDSLDPEKFAREYVDKYLFFEK